MEILLVASLDIILSNKVITKELLRLRKSPKKVFLRQDQCSIPLMKIWYLSYWPAEMTCQCERSGWVVECLTRDRGVVGLSLSSVTVLCH